MPCLLALHGARNVLKNFGQRGGADLISSDTGCRLGGGSCATRPSYRTWGLQ